jgi:hypothetical protein
MAWCDTICELIMAAIIYHALAGPSRDQLPRSSVARSIITNDGNEAGN